MKQTAVEWLVDQLKQFAFDSNHHLGLGDIRLTQGHLDELEEQAKAMEEEQHSTTWIDAQSCKMPDDYLFEEKSFDQYYNETYNK